MVERIEKHLPNNKLGRLVVGIVLMILGVFGIFLPIIGFWLLPLGLAVLAFDFEFARSALRKIRDGLTWMRLRQNARRRSRF